MVCIYIFQDIPSITTREAFAPISKYPLYFGTVLFALEAVGVNIALENNMEKPKDFPRVLNFGMVIIVFLYAGMGFLGYLF
jgi:proton-coupled amino acid transporter